MAVPWTKLCAMTTGTTINTARKHIITGTNEY